MRLFLLLLGLLFAFPFFSQNESNSQKTLITKRTATWCPNCGSWGWDFAKALEDLNNPNAILIRAHYSGDLQSKVAQDLTENFGANYQPEFYLNEDIQSVGSTTWEGKVNSFDNTISDAASASAKVKFNGLAHKTSNGIQLNAEVEFTSDASGEFYFAAYLLEDGIINNQSGRSSEAIHNSVLRKSFTEDSFGNKISDESVSMGQSFVFYKLIDVEGEPVEGRSFKILLMLWEKQGESYVIENVHSFEVEVTSDLSEIQAYNSTIEIYQSNENLILDFEKPMNEKFTLDFYDLQGRNIFSKNWQNNSSDNHLEINIRGVLQNNFYMIKLTGESGKIFTKKIFILFNK